MEDGNSATRKRGGVFLTPLPFAEKAAEYLEETLGTDWTQSGNYRLWDMAAGTGHLEMFLPKEFLKYCYLSTLQHEDVLHLQEKFPDATVFQYNYLDDDADKMPDTLQRDLANPAIKWIILVNPPYATAQEAGLKGTSKEGVSDTKIRKLMHADGLGEVSRELYVQFLYRIVHEFRERETLLGLFSPIKYLVSANYQKFRDRVFQAEFQSGFVFSSENFGGTSKTSHFPVAFILWELYHKQHEIDLCENFAPSAVNKLTAKNAKDSQRTQRKQLEISLDILDYSAQNIGTKTINPADRNDFLSRWIKRPRGTQIFPPFGSALTIKIGNTDIRNRIADGFLASLMCPGNELQNQQQTAFLSGPQASAGALSVTPENFEQAVIVFAARRIPKDTWVNHVDQLLRPNRELSPQFIADCAVWSLFDNKNQTVALRNVVYQNRVYQIVNHFFPFPVTSLCALCESSANFAVNLLTAEDAKLTQSTQSELYETTDSFVANWLAKQTLSTESQSVLETARKIYRLFFAHWNELPRAEFKIEAYDAGWYQIRLALSRAELGADLFAELKDRHDQLKEQILPQLYDYGILSSAF